MKLLNIDKQTYRKRLNVVIFATIAMLTLVSLGLSTLLIALLPSEQGSHFHWNLLGVVVGACATAACLLCLRQHPFMHEVVYVWQLKQELNQITRKMAKVKAGVKAGNMNAFIALHYSYLGSKQLWELDDNTITINELTRSISKLNDQQEKLGLQITTDDYHRELLKNLD